MKWKTSKGPPRYANVIDAICRDARLPEPDLEQRLIPGRRFSCDFVWPAARVVLEIQGGSFQGGRHSFGRGQLTDMEKFNELTLRGWRVLQAAPEHVTDGTVTALLRRALTTEATWGK